MELINKKLDYTVEHYKVEVDTPHGKMHLDVEVEGNNIELGENDESDIWNTLTLEEKEEVREVVENEFIFN